MPHRHPTGRPRRPPTPRRGEPNALPLLLTHGWPSTVADFVELIGPLTEPTAYGATDAPAFDVIAPSLPGFGFCGQPRVAGLPWSRSSFGSARKHGIADDDIRHAFNHPVRYEVLDDVS